MGEVWLKAAYCKPSFNNPPQLLGLHIAGIIDPDVASLLDNLFSGERSLGISPSRIVPPLFDSCYVVEVDAFFIFQIAHVCGYGVCKDHVLGLKCVRQCSLEAASCL
jgi:hypothetical protein